MITESGPSTTPPPSELDQQVNDVLERVSGHIEEPNFRPAPAVTPEEPEEVSLELSIIS